MGLNWLLKFANTILVVEQTAAAGGGGSKEGAEAEKLVNGGGFEMQLHYPRYVRSDYEKMDEVQLDLLLRQYGLKVRADLEEKRKFAMGAFLWPDQ